MADMRIFLFNLQVRINLKIFWSCNWARQRLVLRDCKWVTGLNMVQLLASNETFENFVIFFYLNQNCGR